MAEQPDSIPTQHDAPTSTVAELPAAGRRRRAFRIIAALLPVLLLLLTEGITRLAGYGGYPPVIKFVGSDGTRNWYTTFRPGVDSFFYTNRSHTGGMREWHFVAPKPAGTVRIVMLGGSAMQGYPWPLPLTNGSFLQAMLSDVWPDRQVEVLNLGATAMASFPAVHFLREMLPHQPDLVIVMSGNNEFYGAYGVASLHSSGTSPWGMKAMRWLRGLALTQWLGAAFGGGVDEEAVRNKTLMERVAVRQQIPPDSPLRAAAAQSLYANLVEIVRLCREAGVPVIVCTLPANERGLAPIGLDVAPPLSDEGRATFEKLLADAREATDPAIVEQLTRGALELYTQNAEVHFLRGRALTALGRDEEALIEYMAARDLDTMPWRATSSAQEAARTAAAHGALLCDMEAAFRAESPGGAIGWELLDDHVHYSLRGQALFARTLLRAMAELDGPLRVDPAAAAALPTWEEYAKRLGVSMYQEYVAASRVRTLFNVPFMKESNPEAAERFRQRCDELLAPMSPLDRQAVEHWQDPGLHVSNHRPLAFVVGYYRMMDGDHAAAAELFRSAREEVAPVSLWRLQLSWYYINCRRHLVSEPTEEDKRICAEGIESGELLQRFVGFRDPLGPTFLGCLYNVVGDHEAAIRYLDGAVRYAKGREGWFAVQALADSLIRTGQTGRARLLLELAERDADMADAAREMLERLGGR